MSTGLPSVLALHRYFTWCNYMKGQFESILQHGWTPTGDWADATLQRLFMFCSYWYAGLYVVIEGWSELGLHDAVVDGLLKTTDGDGRMIPHPHVALLKKYRHGVFHFQKTYFDKRFEEFMPLVGHETTVTWVRALHDALSAFFLTRPSRS